MGLTPCASNYYGCSSFIMNYELRIKQRELNNVTYLALTTILRPLTIYMPTGSDRVVGMFADK